MTNKIYSLYTNAGTHKIQRTRMACYFIFKDRIPYFGESNFGTLQLDFKDFSCTDVIIQS